MKLYHLDRTGALQPGTWFDLIPAPEVSIATRAILDPPEQVSRHGAWYLAGNADLSFGFELVWELVRKNQFSDCPSRLTSIFAFSDPSAAGQFARTDDRPRTTWEIEAPDDTRSFDMHWIRGASISVAMANAAMYWSGAASPTPVWEYLVQPPAVTIRTLG